MLPESESIWNIPFFSELSPDELREFMRFSKLMNFKKRETIFLEGDPYLGFFIVIKGVVRVYKSNPDGREITLHIIEPFGSFAEVPLFLEESLTYPASAQALENSTLIFIPKDGFLKILKNNTGICLKMLHGFAKRLISLNQQIENLTLMDVSSRLAEYLYREYEKYGVKEIIVKRTILATYLGTIPETISRTLRKFHEEGLIEVEGKKVKLIKVEKLKSLFRH
ncbi:CRP/FNR family transcriptional regulator, anaerobic regulatory protein [Candidatus Thermokryptus mobilis]|uniref:CRP/FNR family transcriptional regulator, anaerobic regulatory protein n=2 Tax=Candidatus Thermokryptus mobilis TaxID=1643428 RepID=A0A0S4N8F3_9BACT|nr:CRP/FNR family transcriptional regulator, anaerobic regulatory protein [Candidatus Thermokryptus mobilis]